MAELWLLTAEDVQNALRGSEEHVVATVRDAYMAHRDGLTIVPPSCFLRVGSGTPNRIIALPAYLDTLPTVAGVKWIASFPGNVARGLNRASAVIILNSTQDGRAEVVMEGSALSLWRTAASAALAAQVLHPDRDEPRVGVIGCGQVSFEVFRFLLRDFLHVREFWLADLIPNHAERFAARVHDELHATAAERVCTTAEVLAGCRLVVVATTATVPHICDPQLITPAGTMLHLSLRDLSPDVILACDNVVDDPDHVSRESTSVQLAESAVGHTRFVRCTLADILAGTQPARADATRSLVFSPFGLGILDLAVAQFVRRRAEEHRCGLRITNFHRES